VREIMKLRLALGGDDAGFLAPQTPAPVISKVKTFARQAGGNAP
jgi:hypothetical protein